MKKFRNRYYWKHGNVIFPYFFGGFLHIYHKIIIVENELIKEIKANLAPQPKASRPKNLAG
jgi:hypothetical protein